MKAKKCHAFFMCMNFKNQSGTSLIKIYHKSRWRRMGYNTAKRNESKLFIIYYYVDAFVIMLNYKSSFFSQ